MKIANWELPRNEANYEPLSPLSFIERAAEVYPECTAIIYGDLRRSWAETHERCRRLASSLTLHGITAGGVVAVLLPNTPAMVEAHFGVPMAGAVLNTLNTRLDAASIGFMLDHGEVEVLIFDREFTDLAVGALQARKNERPLALVEVNDPALGSGGEGLGGIDYETFLAGGDPGFRRAAPLDEWDAISLNYTSGTTGNPKGVVYHHRGAALNAVSNILEWDMPKHPVYLWTLPMFHCNGWCFPWTVAARAGTNVCLRKVETKAVFEAIREHGVTHYCAAPVVHNMLINAPPQSRQGIQHRVYAMVAGAAPPTAMIEGMERMGFEITHVYGLTETYGPAAVCAPHAGWRQLETDDRAALLARQGVRYHLQRSVDVVDPHSMRPVPADGETMGEVMFKGNIVMKGYLKNPDATREAFADGWFHTGDLAVRQPDGYIKLKDRSKDIIISGGENISSIEVEDVLYRHQAILAAAVVAKPDPYWGEIPCAFVELKPDAPADVEDIIAHCKRHLARFKVPRAVVFGELPRTSTGKIQKFELRKRVGSATAIDV